MTASRSRTGSVRYLAALRRADAGDNGPLGEFVARAVLDNLYGMRSAWQSGVDES